jgi:hypothetical protein
MEPAGSRATGVAAFGNVSSLGMGDTVNSAAYVVVDGWVGQR